MNCAASLRPRPATCALPPRRARRLRAAGRVCRPAAGIPGCRHPPAVPHAPSATAPASASPVIGEGLAGHQMALAVPVGVGGGDGGGAADALWRLEASV